MCKQFQKILIALQNKEIHKSSKFKLFSRVMREEQQDGGGWGLFYRSKMLSDDILIFGLVEASSLLN